MNEFAIAAIGADRPGIVAGVASALTGAGASIEDSSMTILGGQFAMLLLVEAGTLARHELVEVLEPVAERFDLVLQVRAATGASREVDAGAEHVVAAYGPDRPGLVAALAAVLAGQGANITDFGSRLGEGGAFAMWFNVTLPPALDPEALATQLRSAGGAVSLEVSIHRVEAEAL